MFGREEKQAMAQRLIAAADVLGRAIAEIEGLERLDLPTVEAEADAADRIVIDGPDIGRALRTIAMRLDRSAAVKAAKDD
jgi:hypothetical protein